LKIEESGQIEDPALITSFNQRWVKKAHEGRAVHLKTAS
jgi:hypothetical protein